MESCPTWHVNSYKPVLRKFIISAVTGKQFLVLGVVFAVASFLLGVDTSAFAAESWAPKVPPPPSAEQMTKFGYNPYDYQTTFCEAKLGSYAPINVQTSIGLPGVVPIAFSNFMRIRCSEFEVNFSVLTDKGEKRPFRMPNFSQTAPGDWLPGGVSQWDDGGIHYNVGLIMVPNDPQPVDLIKITLKNVGNKPSKGNLIVTLDGASTLKSDGALISDRDKPLVVMDPVVPVERMQRSFGCIDPRAKAAMLTNPAMPATWPHRQWLTCRVGWYGMPVEYLMKVEQGRRLQVFLGFENFNRSLCQEVEATVEGDAAPQKTDTPAITSWDDFITPRRVLRFVGKDTDGDGCVKVSVQAPPTNQQKPFLSIIQAYDMNAKVTAEDVRAWKKLPDAVYNIDVGADASTQSDFRSTGKDPTLFALRLSYTPDLAPGEEKSYLLRVPAIDRPEPAAHTGFTPRPYDTGETWKNPYLPRHPENTAPYGFDVPVGTNPADYAAFGPKSRDVWEKQLAAVRSLSWDDGMARLSRFWDAYLEKGAKFVVPEPVVENLYKKQVAMLAVERIKFSKDDYYVSLDGPDFYWEYTPRGGSYEYMALDWAGRTDMGRESLDTCLTPSSKISKGNRWGAGQCDDPDPKVNGAWVTRPGQWDGQGQILWAIHEHYLLTGDKKWLADNYEAIRRAAEWIIRMREYGRQKVKDPNNPLYGLLPPGGMEGPGINEGNALYLDAWNVKGMCVAEQIAKTLGKSADASRFGKEADDYQAAFDRAVRKSFVRLNDFAGTIPDTAVSESLAAWSQASMIYPTEVISPHDPMITGWLRFREQEASRTGGLMLWPYIGSEVGVAYICRGDYDKAADFFYTYIANAYGTLDWGEEQYLSPPGHPDYPKEFIEQWKDTEPDRPFRKQMTGHGESPHTWAVAFYIEWLRHMLLHEDGDTLHIAPAIPRKWLATVGAGSPNPAPTVGVERAPSHFGLVTYHLTADPDQSTIRGDVTLDPKRKPAKLIIHVRGPGGRGLEWVKINGKNWGMFSGDEIVVPNPPAKTELEATYRR